MIVRRRHVGSASNDIGFKRQGDGTYAAIISEFDRRNYSQSWLDQVAQRYAYHAVVKAIKEDGRVIERERVENGVIELVVCENF